VLHKVEAKPNLNMLCLSVLCFSRDHFNHLCWIKGTIATSYILPHEAKYTLSFWYELLGRLRSANRSRSWCLKIFLSRSMNLKVRIRSGVRVWKMWLRSSLTQSRGVQDPVFRTRVRQGSAHFQQTGPDPDYGFIQVFGSGFSNFIWRQHNHKKNFCKDLRM